MDFGSSIKHHTPFEMEVPSDTFGDSPESFMALVVTTVNAALQPEGRYFAKVELAPQDGMYRLDDMPEVMQATVREITRDEIVMWINLPLLHERMPLGILQYITAPTPIPGTEMLERERTSLYQAVADSLSIVTGTHSRRVV